MYKWHKTHWNMQLTKRNNKESTENAGLENDGPKIPVYKYKYITRLCVQSKVLMYSSTNYKDASK